MKITKIFIVLAFTFAFTGAFADGLPVQIIGNETVSIPTNQPAYIFKSGAKNQDKQILLQRIKLSTEAKENIIEQLETFDDEVITPLVDVSTPELQPKVDLQMNNVPVLDQGMHGSCVTFAITAAIDAVYGKGDYISQLCNLSLGSYLEKISAGSYPSGWDGSYNETVFQQIKTYGIMSMQQQLDKNIGCAGLNEYPAKDINNTGNALSPETFALYSENIMSNMSAIYHLNMKDAFTNKVNMENVFTKVKKALNNQHRVIIGFVLDDKDGSAGADGTYNIKDKDKHNTWLLTPRIARHFRSNAIHAGHAIIITGYDDTAIIYKNKTRKTTGAFILRNSWGESNGDKGNYYMSYDYFKTLAAEVIELAPTPASQAVGS